MERVVFEFNNIQSHERTRFELKPGLNFILADDNNVGKSTIFKAILVMLKMPQVSNDDLQELLRAGTLSGYVAMKFPDESVVFWMVREGDRVRAFFETHRDGEVVRTASCPSSVLTGLDIVRGEDGSPINFNDADSVQLIVQDTAKNDEVLAKVLVDLDVENVRKNAAVLDRQVLQDYKVVQAKHADSTAILEGMTYNDAVEAFNVEKDLLYAAVSVMDCLDINCGGLASVKRNALSDIKDIEAAVQVLLALEATTVISEFKEKDFAGFSELVAAVDILQKLTVCDADLLCKKSVITKDRLANIQPALLVLDTLRKVVTSLDFLEQAIRKTETCSAELERASKELAKVAQRVVCPVKGEVYFGETCIPTGN